MRELVGRVSMCEPPDATPWVGVLGIMSVGGSSKHRAYRDAFRARDAVGSGRAAAAEAGGAGILPKFVLRGLSRNASGRAELVSEAARFHDVTFVRARDSLDRTAGPLASLLLWYECALTAWPNAQHIGKADDDVWIDLPAVAAHLRGTHAALQRDFMPSGVAARLYWGLMESWSWDVSGQQPTDGRTFGYKFGGGQSCTRNTAEWIRFSGWFGKQATRSEAEHDRVITASLTRGNATAIAGPFPFAKGPLHFATSDLINGLVGNAAWRRTLEQAPTRAPKVYNRTRAAGKPVSIRPYDDVLVGMGLATSAIGAGLVAVHMGAALFAEPFGVYTGVRNSTLLWHEKGTKNPTRMAHFHRYAGRRRCVAPRVTLRCGKAGGYRSCTGAPWRQCLYVHNASEARHCSSAKIKRAQATVFRPEYAP